MMKVVDIFLPVIGIGLLLALCVVMVRRRVHREYPFFFAYVVFSLLSATSCFLTMRSENTYGYVYWVSNGVSAVFVLFALNEVLYDVFHGFYSFWWFRLIFPSIIAVMCFLVVRRAVINPRSTQLLMSVIFYVTGAVSLIQCGVFVVFMLLATGLRVSFRRYPYYIALGFAISSMGDWTFYSLVSGSGYSLAARYAAPVAYLSATIMWLWCFSGKPEPEPKLEFGRAATLTRV